jgi:hypothetical protein
MATKKKAAKKTAKKAASKKAPKKLPSGKRLFIDGKQVSPGKKVKLEEHMKPTQVATLVAQKAAEKEVGDADDVPG